MVARTMNSFIFALECIPQLKPIKRNDTKMILIRGGVNIWYGCSNKYKLKIFSLYIGMLVVRNVLKTYYKSEIARQLGS